MRIMNDMVVQALADYLDESDTPSIGMGQQEFEELSISRWAAVELINAIMDHPFYPAEETIFWFATNMRTYSLLAGGETSKQGLIFLIAADFADEVVTYLKGEQII